jgi:feruloyl esterase
LRDWNIRPDKLALVDAAVMSSCDAADGVTDGLIQDPRKCSFDPASLLCSVANNSNCLNEAQVAGLKAVYAGASKTNGRIIYPGLMKSDPAVGDNWATWITGLVPPDAPGTPEPWSDSALAPWQFLFQDQVLKFFVFGDSAYNSLSFNLNSSDLTKTQLVMNRGGAEGANPDLSSFQTGGGKLIIYHGWSDAAFSPLETVRYYDAVVRQQSSLNDTEQFARLFMAPGMQHCIGSGPGPNVFDPLSSLLEWVEKGKAPDQVIAAIF